MKNIFLIIAVAFANIVTAQQTGTFKDSRDGKTYQTVKIGNQTWMAENLNYKTSSDSWCYDDRSSNCDTYGRLYNWETAKKACPEGWHLPSKSEFETLLSNVGGEGSDACYDLKRGGSSGFSALFGGWRGSSGNFLSIGDYGYFWSSSPDDSSRAWGLGIYSSYEGANVSYGRRGYGLSVRCLQD